VPPRGTLGPVRGNFLINFLIIWPLVIAVSLLVRTPQDRLARMRKGRDIGIPWSGSCVASRSIDLVVPMDRVLDMAAEAMVAVHGSEVTVDPVAWSVHGWTGIHLGSYGWQLTILVTRTGTNAFRLTCVVRPRCSQFQISMGAAGRKAERMIRALQPSARTGPVAVGLPLTR
jgi:hypothetical protein